MFAHTSPHRKQDRQYSASAAVPLIRPTADTRLLAEAAILGLRAIYRDGYRYEKAAVMLVKLQPDTVRQWELDFTDDAAEPQYVASRDQSKLMSAMNVLNGRYGKGSVQLGSSSIDPLKRPWSMKAYGRTPRYTTIGEEMAIAIAYSTRSTASTQRRQPDATPA